MAATILAVFPWLTSKLSRQISVTGTRAQDFASSDSESAPKGKGTRRRKTKARAKNNPTAGQTSAHDLPDDLLDRVLLDLDSPLHVVRAAATCRRWRRAVAAGDFLARFTALHGGPPRVDGHYYVTSTRQPADAPAMKLVMFVPAAASAAVHGLFSLDFLYPGLIKPKPGVDPAREYQWATLTQRGRRGMEIVDSSGSLLLLSTPGARRSPDFAVCEPVTRGYRAITSPAGLDRFLFLGAFLLDGDGGGGGAANNTMSDFMVISVLCERNKTYWSRGTPRACVFRPGTDGGWQLGWHTTDDDVEVRPVQLNDNPIHLAGRVAGRIYWGMETGTGLVLDEGTLKFSLLTLPDHMRWQYKRTSFRVIGGVDDDTVRVVRMDGEELAVYGQLPGSDQWVVEKSVRLRDAAAGLPGWKDSFLALPARIVTAGETFVVLTPAEEKWIFSVELETMEVEREHERNWHDGTAYPCALPWPPVLKACVDHGDVVGKRRQRRRRKR